MSSDGQAAFAIDLLSMQLHEQFMAQQTGLATDNVGLRQRNAQLVNDYNDLVSRYNALRQAAQQAGARIADLEHRLAAAELAREKAELEAEFERRAARFHVKNALRGP